MSEIWLELTNFDTIFAILATFFNFFQKPWVGMMWVMSSSESFLRIVVLPSSQNHKIFITFWLFRRSKCVFRWLFHFFWILTYRCCRDQGRGCGTLGPSFSWLWGWREDPWLNLNLNFVFLGIILSFWRLNC